MEGVFCDKNEAVGSSLTVHPNLVQIGEVEWTWIISTRLQWNFEDWRKRTCGRNQGPIMSFSFAHTQEKQKWIIVMEKQHQIWIYSSRFKRFILFNYCAWCSGLHATAQLDIHGSKPVAPSTWHSRGSNRLQLTSPNSLQKHQHFCQ